MSRNRFGLHIIPPSVKFLQCQTTLRNALKTSPNVEIIELWKSTSTNKNIQYDVYTTTKEVIKDFSLEGRTQVTKSIIHARFLFQKHLKICPITVDEIMVHGSVKSPKEYFQF